MIELEPVELVLEAMHYVAVRLHLLIVAAGFLHHLIDDELRISPDVKALDAKLDGDAEATEKGLVLQHVVGHVLSEG